MRFTVEQHYPADVADVLALYTDPAFYPALDGLPRVSAPEVLDLTRAGDVVTVQVRYRFTAPLPRAALSIIDPAKLTWIDRTAYDLDAATASTQLLPDHYPDRLTASAAASFVAVSGGRTVRRVEGDLAVHVPLVGGKVERAIVDGLREHLADEADVASRRLSADPSP